MKVILTAFNRKLTSQPMDWPEAKRGEIYMIMDMDKFEAWNTEEEAAEFSTVPRKAKFVPTGRFFDGNIEEYKLVDVS